jgi:hypothetical protein
VQQTANPRRSFVENWSDVMNIRVIVLSAFLAALWIFGLVGQFHSAEAGMRYLALSMVILAVGVWRWQPRPALRRRYRDRQHPRE